ncbi:tripartite tricarboxylate transporter substrate binding protein [Pararhizobium sp. IMCC21322]|uniref:Bug family tripartite tricarboxylate transporter substrate binding protein n=1 Tax=Pararhizobium sp. IMCC21322 TaxID=3067903 RepID=UPI0027409DA3|nr:tripartite tricarboxylate transporter substrate binding protein [Pararhizobium sp. IMCC21322]
MKLKLIATVTLLALPTLALADGHTNYPEKRVNVLIPFNPGGGVDATGRLMAAEFEKFFDANFVVKNVSGAGGTIGATQLAQSDADGYTIGVLPIGTATTQPHRKELPYNGESWEEVCLMVKSPLAVLVNKEGKYQSIEALVEAAKSGETVLVGGPPKGSVPHMAQAALGQAFDTEFTFVPFEGGAGASKAVLGKEVDFTVEPFGSGKKLGLNPLVVLAPERVGDLPDVPSIKEINGSDLDLGIWFGLFVPAGTPDGIVSKLDEACAASVASDDFKAGIANVGWNINYLGSSDFTSFFAKQYATNGELLKSLGLVK